MLSRSTRDGQLIEVRPQHHSHSASQAKDKVVRAVAWEDGSADFVFGDGSVFSFCDTMNTFVAFTPRAGAARKRAQSGEAHRGGAPAQGGSSPADSLYEKDMLFTAWTLSRYAAKVREALGVFNFYSPTPRLIDGLLDSPTRHWQQRSAMEALVLVNDKKYLERRRVTVNVEVREELAPTVAQTGLSERRSVNSGGQELAKLETAALAGAAVMREVELGVEATLWCAARQTSLTLHANKATFSVRWPAPVVQPKGTRASHLPPGFPLFSMPATDALSVSNAMSVREALRHTKPYTYVTQTFPIACPPPAWATMLHLAQRLHNETPEDECFRDTGTQQDGWGGEGSTQDEEEQSGDLLYLTLPPVAETTSRHSTCRFSCMEVDDVHRLIASGRHLGCDLRHEGPRMSRRRLRWRYDADPMGHEPAAIYWNVDPTLNPPAPTESDGSACGDTTRTPLAGETANDMPSAILAVVGEDGSTLSVTPGTHGYTVLHSRCDGSVKAYHVSADGSVSLPPSLGQLSFPAHKVRRCASSRFLPGEGEGADSVFAVQHSDLVQSRQWALLGSPEGSGIADQASSPFYGNRGDVAELPYPILGLSPCTLSSSALSPHPSAAPGCGRYLSCVGNIAIELARHHHHYHRPQHPLGGILLPAAQSEEEDATVPATGYHHHPQTKRETIILDGATDGSLFRPHIGGRAEATDSVVFLSTRLDGVGNFTALTNGVVRCQFDDRTILHILPGANDFDEEGLVADCRFRDATRCTMRLTQCTPIHAMFRYVSFALPFRRYVLMRAAERNANHGQADDASAAFTDSILFDRGTSHVPLGNSLPPRSEKNHQAHLATPVRSHATNEGQISLDEQDTAATTALSSSLPTSPIRHVDPHSFAAHPPHRAVRGSEVLEESAAPPAAATAFGLQVRSWNETMREREAEHDLALRAESQRVSTLLALNDSIGARNRSLLSQW